MPAPSLARNFFEHLVGPPGRSDADRAAAVRELVNADPPTYETDWLDFKREETTNPRYRDAKYREQLSEAMSGFGNAGGGVLVWGVVATKADRNGVPTDHAHSMEPIEKPSEVAEKLRGWAGQATDPPLGGVEVVAVLLPDRPDRGLVVLYVPDGPLKPYRAEMVAGKAFYLRAGDSTPIMPYRALAAMFYPRASPVFQATAHLRWRPPQDRGPNESRIECQIHLRNAGSATATDLYVETSYEMPGRFSPVGEHSGARCLAGGGRARNLIIPTPLHPAMTIELTSVQSEVPEQEREGWPSADRYPLVHASLKVYCRDHPPQRLILNTGLERLMTSRFLEVELSPVQE